MIITKKVIGIATSQKISETEISYQVHNLETKEITDNEYNLCLATISKLHRFIGDVQLYLTAEWNYQDYREIIDHYRQMNYQNIQTLIKARILIIDINRVLLNLLSSVRMYLDHTETIIKRRYGEISQNWKNFEQACNNAYDDSFSYRFLYKLRNYAQHCGLPINEISSSVKEHPERAGEPIHELKFGLNRDTALSEYNWGKQLNKELSEQPEIIELDQHVHSLMQSIRRINRVFALGELAELHTGADHINELAKSVGFSDKDYGLGLYELEVLEDEQGEIIKILGFREHRIPIDIVQAALNNDLDQLVSINLHP